jgi:hypothetical protein
MSPNNSVNTSKEEGAVPESDDTCIVCRAVAYRLSPRPVAPVPASIVSPTRAPISILVTPAAGGPTIAVAGAAAVAATGMDTKDSTHVPTPPQPPQQPPPILSASTVAPPDSRIITSSSSASATPTPASSMVLDASTESLPVPVNMTASGQIPVPL